MKEGGHEGYAGNKKEKLCEWDFYQYVELVANEYLLLFLFTKKQKNWWWFLVSYFRFSERHSMKSNSTDNEEF